MPFLRPTKAGAIRFNEENPLQNSSETLCYRA